MASAVCSAVLSVMPDSSPISASRYFMSETSCGRARRRSPRSLRRRTAGGRNRHFRENMSVAEFEVIDADVTKLEVDAIANAANTELRHGGGVAAAISPAGGPWGP